MLGRQGAGCFVLPLEEMAQYGCRRSRPERSNFPICRVRMLTLSTRYCSRQADRSFEADQ